MHIGLIKSKKILILCTKRAGTTWLIDKLKLLDKNILLEHTSRRSCCNLHLIGEKSRKEGGSCRYLKIMDSLQNIPIEDLKTYKIYVIIRNPYERLLSNYLQAIGRGDWANLSFENMINDYYSSYVIKKNDKNIEKYFNTGPRACKLYWYDHYFPLTDTKSYYYFNDEQTKKWNNSKFQNFLKFINSIIDNGEGIHEIIESKNLFKSKLLNDLNIPNITNLSPFQILKKNDAVIPKNIYSYTGKQLVNLCKRYNCIKGSDCIDTGAGVINWNNHEKFFFSNDQVNNFYNQDLLKKTSEIFKKDLIFFKKHGFDFNGI